MRKDYALKLNAAQSYQILTKDQMETLHSCALEILNDVGQDVQHKGAREMLKEAGCLVEKKRVHIKPALVEWAIKQAPSRILMYDRDGEMAMDLSDRNAYFGTGSDCPTFYDWDTKSHKNFTTKDMEDGARICDALENIDFLMCLGLMYEFPVTSYEHQFAAMLRNSTKPMVVTAADRESIKNIADIAAVVRGGREQLINKPLFLLYDEPTSPLNHTFDAIDKLIYCAENGLPTNYSPGMMMGATGPMTIAGALVQGLAEALLGLVVHQLAKPGAPFLFGGCLSNMDMKCMQPTYTSPESNLAQFSIYQMGREKYNLPTWGIGGSSGSKVPDAQALNEAVQQAYMAGLTGSNLNHDVGFMNYGLTFSFELLVMMDEAIGQLRTVFKGVEINEETLAMDLIKEVGPKGNYMAEEHTVKYNRQVWMPGITDRSDVDGWKAAGSTTMEERAAAKVKDIIENYVPKPLTEKQEAEITELLRIADEEAVNRTVNS